MRRTAPGYTARFVVIWPHCAHCENVRQTRPALMNWCTEVAARMRRRGYHVVITRAPWHG